MKNTVLLSLFCIIAFYNCYSQVTIYGYVYDSLNKSPIKDAHVKVQGEWRAYTNRTGYFSVSLDTKPTKSTVLISVNASNYNSVIDKRFEFDKPILIYMSIDCVKEQKLLREDKAKFKKAAEDFANRIIELNEILKKKEEDLLKAKILLTSCEESKNQLKKDSSNLGAFVDKIKNTDSLSEAITGQSKPFEEHLKDYRKLQEDNLIRYVFKIDTAYVYAEQNEINIKLIAKYSEELPDTIPIEIEVRALGRKDKVKYTLCKNNDPQLRDLANFVMVQGNDSVFYGEANFTAKNYGSVKRGFKWILSRKLEPKIFYDNKEVKIDYFTEK